MHPALEDQLATAWQLAMQTTERLQAQVTELEGTVAELRRLLDDDPRRVTTAIPADDAPLQGKPPAVVNGASGTVEEAAWP